MQQKPIEGYINSTQEHTLKDSKMEKKKKSPKYFSLQGAALYSQVFQHKANLRWSPQSKLFTGELCLPVLMPA